MHGSFKNIMKYLKGFVEFDRDYQNMCVGNISTFQWYRTHE
jgi:hypothetical protein